MGRADDGGCDQSLFDTSLRPPSVHLNDMDVNFRKIDVDVYDEDILHESELYDADPRDPAQALDDAKQKQGAVRSALAKYVVYIITSILFI